MMNFVDDQMDKEYSLLCKYKNDHSVDEKVLNFSTVKTIGELIVKI